MSNVDPKIRLVDLKGSSSLTEVAPIVDQSKTVLQELRAEVAQKQQELDRIFFEQAMDDVIAEIEVLSSYFTRLYDSISSADKYCMDNKAIALASSIKTEFVQEKDSWVPRLFRLKTKTLTVTQETECKFLIPMEVNSGRSTKHGDTPWYIWIGITPTGELVKAYEESLFFRGEKGKAWGCVAREGMLDLYDPPKGKFLREEPNAQVEVGGEMTYAGVENLNLIKNALHDYMSYLESYLMEQDETIHAEVEAEARKLVDIESRILATQNRKRVS